VGATKGGGPLQADNGAPTAVLALDGTNDHNFSDWNKMGDTQA